MAVTNNYYDKALVEMAKSRPDMKKVFFLLEKSLKLGNPEAAYALGTWYLHGRYVKKNIKKAVALLRQSAKDNVPNAIFDMAVCYEKGVGVRKNPRKSMEHYLRAFLYGDKQSTYEIGRCYYYGIGVSKDRRLAKIWLDRARGLGVGNRKTKEDDS